MAITGGQCITQLILGGQGQTETWTKAVSGDKSYMTINRSKDDFGRYTFNTPLPPRDAMFTHTASNSTLNVSNVIKDKLGTMGWEVLNYHCYAVDLPCSNFQIVWPIKKLVQKHHLGAACD